MSRYAKDADPTTSGRTPYRPVDGFVVGGEENENPDGDIWVLVSRPGEGLIDFFLDDDASGVAPDPRPRACLGVEEDGTLRIGALDWETDRFLSELMEERAAEALL